MKPVISIVIPTYNEEAVLETSYKRLSEVLAGIEVLYELIFVDDASHDKTLEILEELHKADDRVKIVSFSRNFGQMAAITAGIEYSSGDAVVVIDADLQDPPEVIPLMVSKWREGYDVVYGKRIKRHGDSAFKKASAALYYRLLRTLTSASVDIPVDTGEFRLIDRKVCDTLNSLRERNRFMRGLVSWVGFKQTYVEFERLERFAGETKYSLRKMIELSINGITSFSNKPLRLASALGVFASVIGFIWLIILFFGFLFGRSAEGWVVVVAVVLLTQGIVFFTVGVMGEYLGRVYDEVKDRPNYIVKESSGFDGDHDEDRKI